MLAKTRNICFNIFGDNMKFKNVLLASDFDGTLKNDEGIITKQDRDAIAYFMSEGGFFTVCTGRSYQGFHLYSPEYINAPVLLANGAMAYDYEAKKLIFNDTIGEESFGAIRAVNREFPDAAIEMYPFRFIEDGKTVNPMCYAINPTENSQRHFTSQNIDFSVVSDPSEGASPWPKLMIAAHGFSQEVQKLLDGYPQIKYLKTTGDYVEILRCGSDKGTGLLKLADYLGCAHKDAYAAGDGYNDIEMLVAAAGGFVPENGSPEALAVAKYVTCSNNDGCIANAIEILDRIYGD